MAETSAEIQTRLANVRAAIARVLELQSYSKPGMSATRANLDVLLKHERQLELKLSRMDDGGAIILGDFAHEEP